MKALVLVLILATTSWGAITRTQEKSNATGAATNPNVVTFTSGTLSNAFVMVCAALNAGTNTTASITNDKGDSAVAWPIVHSGNLFNFCWYFMNPTAGSKAYTVTLSNAGTINFFDTFAAEYAGVNNTTQPDVTIPAGVTNTSASCTTGSVSPTAAGDLLVAFEQMASTNGVSGGSGTWNLVDTADGNGYADNLNGTSTASQHLIFGSSSTGQNGCEIAAFKASSGVVTAPTMPAAVY